MSRLFFRKAAAIFASVAMIASLGCFTNISSFAEGADRVLTDIAITTEPTREVYAQGEDFDPTGMTVLASYSDGSTDVLDYSDDGYDGYTAAIQDNGVVIVNYKEDGISKDAVITISLLDTSVPEKSNGAYKLGSENDLKWFTSVVNAGSAMLDSSRVDTASLNAVLTSDLDMRSVTDYEPIGTSSVKYTGKFDGKGHSITLDIDGGEYVGLFGYVTSPAEISNVIVRGSLLGTSYVGGIAGCITGGTIKNCGSYASINASGSSSGSASGSTSGSTSGSSSGSGSGSAESAENSYGVGGVAGLADAADGAISITGCFSRGTASFTGSQTASASGASEINGTGGVIGAAYASSYDIEISKCSDTGDISSSQNEGGIAGLISVNAGRKAAISDCYTVGDITSSESDTQSTGAVFGKINNLGTLTISKIYYKQAAYSDASANDLPVGLATTLDATQSAQIVSYPDASFKDGTVKALFGTIYKNGCGSDSYLRHSWESTHNLISTRATEPTCTTAGNSLYYTCSDCARTFSDLKANEEIAADSWVIAAEGHDYEAGTWTWTNEKIPPVTGTLYITAKVNLTCSKCGDVLTKSARLNNSTESAYIDEEVKSVASCTAVGRTVYTATVKEGGKTFTDSYEATTAATGHNYDDPVWIWTGNLAAKAFFICSNVSDGIECGATKVVSAAITDSVTAEPDCKTDTDGVRTYTATVTFNGATYTDTRTETVEAQHTSRVVDAKEATCTADGHTAGTECSVCGKILSGCESIPATGHNISGLPITWTWNDDYTSATANLTCKAVGCGEVVTLTATSAAGQISSCVDEEPTCVNYGTTLYSIDMTVNKGLANERRILSSTSVSNIEPRGHSIVTDKGYASTHKANGLTDGTHCETCGQILTVQKVIPRIGYDYTVETYRYAPAGKKLLIVVDNDGVLSEGEGFYYDGKEMYVTKDENYLFGDNPDKVFVALIPEADFKNDTIDSKISWKASSLTYVEDGADGTRTGDVDGNGLVDNNDATIVYQLLLYDGDIYSTANSSITDLVRLRCDTKTASTTVGGRGSTNDVEYIMAQIIR